jgi:hypothetical protein
MKKLFVVGWLFNDAVGIETIQRWMEAIAV